MHYAKFSEILHGCFSLNSNNSANISTTEMKHISLCSQEQDRSIYLRNTLVKNHERSQKKKVKNIKINIKYYKYYIT